MTEVQMRELVSATFASAWPSASGGVPFGIENEAGALPPPGSDFYAYLTIQPTTSVQRTTGRAGTRRIQRNLWIQIKLWGPIDTGAKGLAALGDVAQNILELVSLPSPVAGDDPVTTQASQAGPNGASTDGRYYMALVRVPAWYRETK